VNSDRNILIFAGAGASKAVAPDLYPTTVEFFQDLPSNIKNNSLFTRVVEFLKDSSSNDPIDIELVLWRLQELVGFCSLVNDQSSLPGWMLAGNRLINSLDKKSNQNIGHLSQISSRANQQLNKLIDEINARVYDLYSKLPPENRLDETWAPLLDQLSLIGPKIEVVTTNYDMVIEAALDKNKIVDNGWRGSIVRSLDSDIWAADAGTRNKGLLTKLHGSVNWTRDNNQIYVSDPLFKGSHESHVIIYPGFKGRPSEPTFQLFHNHFRKALDSAMAVVFIGFAFRDEYINEICERGIKAQTITSVINPARVKLPFSSNRNQYVESPFDIDAVSEVSNFIRKHINV
jgi:hypothetical protein